MSFYCLCEQRNDKPDNQAFMAPNRYCQSIEGEDYPSFALQRPMECIKMGATQVVLDPPENKPNDWSEIIRPQGRRHFPNIDIFECPNCHARIVRE